MNISKLKLSADSKYMEFFFAHEEFYREAIKQIEKYGAGKGPKPPLEAISILLFAKAIKSFAAMVILMDSGYCEDAIFLLRTLAELAIQWEYICTGNAKEIEGKAQQYVDFAFSESERINLAIQEIHGNKLKKNKHFPNFFSKKSMKKMADEINNEHLKRIFKFYSFYSAPSHSGPYSYKFYLEIDKDFNFSACYLPSDKNIQFIASIGIDLMGEIFVLWSNSMKLNNDKIVERLKKKAELIYNMIDNLGSNP